MKAILRQFLQREAHPVIQFLKYAISGGAATAVDVALFYLLATTVLPALKPDDIVARLLKLSLPAITEAVRARNYVINKAITFVFGNLTAYILNILWVFKPGRHPLWKEVALFYIVSVTSWAIGSGLGWLLIWLFGWQTTLVYVVNMVTSLSINFVCRKYLIFHG